MNRGDFIRMGMATGAFLACPNVGMTSEATTRANLIWAFMAQFGVNMWGDIVKPPERDGLQEKLLSDEEFAVISRPGYADHGVIHFDEAMWTPLATRVRRDGSNLLLIDLGEFVVYPSHPELAVKGSWSAERMNAEVKRLKALGFQIVPKLNFSCCHDIWLKDYARMVSTATYYRVVADLIRDAFEIFDKPEFVHLGLDEEDIVEYQSRNTSLVRFRQGDLWWHDVMFMIGEVEKLGARAWIWSDYLRRHTVEEFNRRMPKTVLQSPWTYRTEKPTLDDPLVRIFLTLAENGYDVIPCGSNCYGLKDNFPAMAKFCKDNLPSEHFKGMLMAPWAHICAPYGRLLNEASSLVGEAIRRVEG